ncbi:MAG: kelch repeat-containing protein [Acidobacteriaceae bacterium]
MRHSSPAFKNLPATLVTLSAVISVSLSPLLVGCSGIGGGGGTTPPPPPPSTYTVGGTVTGLLAGNSITLTDNGSDSLTVTANGAFTFAPQLDSGAAYSLTLAAPTPTAQPCTSTYGAGIIDGADVNLVNVFCGLPGGAGTFTAAGSLTTARDLHTATLLANGDVLAVGGAGAGEGLWGIGAPTLASSELYSPATGTWTASGSLATGRYYHTATLLPNGNVLIAAGQEAIGDVLAASELYNPTTGTFTATGSLENARAQHTATLLPSGQVLVAGGITNVPDAGAMTGICELYDPSTGAWSTTGSLNLARDGHTATLLANGKVLVVGGEGPSLTPTTAELYGPSSGTWTETGSLATGRFGHTATLLPNGQVLVAGGFGPNDTFLASVELYDPTAGTWTTTGSMANGRAVHTATLLPDGKVMVTGGEETMVSTSELYDPASGTWTETGAAVVLWRQENPAVLLTSGKVLIAGGIQSATLTSAELYF